MEIDVTSIIVEKLSRNRGPDPLNPDNRIVPDSERPCWYAFKPDGILNRVSHRI